VSAPGLVASLSAGNSVLGLLWGSTSGMLTAMTMLLGQKILSLSTVMETFVAGMKVFGFMKRCSKKHEVKRKRTLYTGSMQREERKKTSRGMQIQRK
jgi:hypothetical protein